VSFEQRAFKFKAETLKTIDPRQILIFKEKEGPVFCVKNGEKLI
jgi:hypothetical protein